MYVAITSPYLRDRGVTKWYQSLDSHLVWITTWVNSWALTNSTIRFRLTDLYLNWGSSNEYKNTMTLTLHSLTRLYSFLPSSCQPEHPIFFSLSMHRLASHSLGCSLLYFSVPSSLSISECAAEVSWTRNISALGLEMLFSHRNGNCEDAIFVRWGEM